MSDPTMRAAREAGAMRAAPEPGAPARVPYDFAVLRVVPHVHLGAFVPVGVVLHSRPAEFLGMRVLDDPAELAWLVPDLDAELLARYLRACRAICDGDPAAGPVALASPPERFHWLTAPRSDVLQSSPVHEGLCGDPARALDELYDFYVTAYVGRAAPRVPPPTGRR